MGGSTRETDARAGWTEAVRDQAPVLHALGYALAGSHDGAEDLLQAGLAALAVDWDGPDDPSRLLVVSCRAVVARHQQAEAAAVSPGERVVVTQAPPDHHDPDLERRLPAWQRLRGLDPADRSTLVTRLLPTVRDLDRAKALGVHRREVGEREQRADAAFGEGLDELPAALAAVVGQLPPVAVDAEGALRLAAPRQRRRTVAAVAVVAAVLVVAGIVGVGLTSDDGPPGTPDLDLAPLEEPEPVALADLPEGPPTSLPYWSAGVLTVDGRAFRTVVPRTLERAGGTVLVGGAGRTQVVTEGAIAGLPGGITSVRLSPDGRTVAWVAVQQVAAAGIGDDGQLGEPVTFDAGELAEPGDVVRVQSVLGDGRVVVQVAEAPVGSELGNGSSGRAFVWTPGEEPVEIGLPADVLLDFDPVPWSGGISWLVPGLGIVLAAVGDDGEARPVGQLAFGGGAWDPEGRVMAQVYAKVPYVVSPFEGGFAPTRLPLPTPDNGSWRAVGWEDDGHVVVAVADPGSAGRTLVRCAVPELTCERVTGAPDGGAVLP